MIVHALPQVLTSPRLGYRNPGGQANEMTLCAIL